VYEWMEDEEETGGLGEEEMEDGGNPVPSNKDRESSNILK
jgi:hypothetical protein